MDTKRESRRVRPPRRHLGITALPHKRKATVLAGIRAGGTLSNRLPACLFKAGSGYDGEEGIRYWIRPLTVAGAAQAEGDLHGEGPFLLPVELRRANHAASTNDVILRLFVRQSVQCDSYGLTTNT